MAALFSLSFGELTGSQISFVEKVSRSVWEHGQAALKPSAIYGDGSESPNGERFAAVRNDSQYDLIFDFGVGRLYRTAVYLPVEEAPR